nr:V5 [Tranosema rostrale ichnovirus]
MTNRKMTMLWVMIFAAVLVNGHPTAGNEKKPRDRLLTDHGSGEPPESEETATFKPEDEDCFRNLGIVLAATGRVSGRET